MILKNLVRTVALASASVAALALANPAAAQSQTGNIAVAGKVKANCYITITDTGNIGEFVPNDSINFQVGTVYRYCNKKNGYTLDVESVKCTSTSATAARLGSTDLTPTEYITYAVTFDSDTGNLSSACTEQLLNTSAKDAGTTSTVNVVFTVPGTAEAGSYSDTLTFTMTVK